jgi:hypothetical protein
MPATSDTTDFSYATPASPDTADLTGATSSNSQGSLFSATSSGLQTLDIVITNILSDNKKIAFEPYNNQFTLSDGTTGYSALHYATEIQVIGLNYLDNVNITGTPADNEVLAYDTTSSKWINQTAAEANIVTSANPVITGTISGNAFLDEDDMSSNSAVKVASQQSIKAYVDSQVTAQDLDFSGDNGGAQFIDLDSQSLTLTGGTGIDTTGSAQTMTFAIDSTVVQKDATQTLTAKTLTTPVIASLKPSGSNTLTMPDATDTIVGRATTDTLTNKTLTTPVINGFSGTGNASIDGVLTTTGNIELGHASDNTLSASSGVLSIEGKSIVDTGGTGLTKSSSSSSTLNLDTNSLTEAAIADGDYIVFNDATDSNAPKKEALADVATLFAGTGLSASSSVLSVDSSQTQITEVGTITTGVWSGTAIANNKLANSTVSYGGVSLALGASDATPAFDLTDATNYPTTSLTGYITNNQLAGSIANTKLANSTITVTDGSSSTATDLGGTITFNGTTNEIEVGEASGTITVGLPNNVTIAGNLTVNGTTTTVDTDNLTVKDSLISLARNNSTSDTLDIGFYGLYNTSGSQELYAGLFRDASDNGKFKLTKDIPNAPGDGVMGIGGTVATLVANLESTALTVTGDATFTGDSYNAVWDKNLNVLRFNDNAKIGLGGSSMGDFRMFHQSSSNNTLLQNWTGNLEISQNAGTNADIKLQAYDQSSGAVDYIVCDSGTGEVQLYHAASGSSSAKLATKSTGVDITGTITTDGATHDGDVTFTGTNYNVVWNKSTNSLKFADGAEAMFGSQNDFAITHPGGTFNTTFKNYTNNLAILNYANDKNVDIYTDNGSGGTAVYFRADGSIGEVQLYHYGSPKFATKSTGVDITGTITTDGLTVDGDVTFTGADYNAVWTKAGNIFRIEDNGFITIGSNNDLYFQHDSNNSLITNQTGDLTISNTSNDKDIIIRTDNQNGGVVEYVVADGSEGEVKLYHAASGSSSVKLTTKSTGVEVTGTIELNHASDTTISRVSPGVIAVEGKNLSTVDDATALAIALG